MEYNWQWPDWPDFKYDLSAVQKSLLEFAERTGEISGMLKGLSEELQEEAILDFMVTEAVKTSEIEGEFLNREDVKSSIRNRLGLNTPAEQVKDKRAIGIAELTITARESFAAPLSEKMLLHWHELLMQGVTGITVGSWRTHTDPMQVVSGSISNPKVHYEAPPSSAVPEEMAGYVKWFNATASGAGEVKPPLVRSAIAHLYFESIHPFEDGNGRLGRVLSEKVLAQGIGRPEIISLSKAIESKKSEYYRALEAAQRSNEITDWIEYFVEMALEARIESEKIVLHTLKVAKLFDTHREHLNERQLKVVQKMVAAGPDGFEGGMSPRKYISLTGASKATATRDLQSLYESNVLRREGDGRSTRYYLNI